MKTLIVEDDFTSRLLLQRLLKSHGPTHIAINGLEAVAAVELALEMGEPYHLICLDIMMPELDGQEALKQIRAREAAKGIWSTHGAKIVMTTVLKNMKNVNAAFGSLCDAYLVKPINQTRLLETLHQLSLIKFADDRDAVSAPDGKTKGSPSQTAALPVRGPTPTGPKNTP